MWLHIQQAKCTRHQHLIDMRVDLGKVCRLERHDHAKLGQRITQLRHAFIKQCNRLQPARLQPPLQARMNSGKGTQFGFVALAQVVHMSQHQCSNAVAAGQFDLRHGFFRVQTGNQRAQWQQHVADMRRQHRTVAHISYKAAFSLMKPHQHLALFSHIAHRQARTVTVAPGWSFNGPHHVVGFKFANVLQVVFKYPLLDGDLSTHMQVLHFATTTRPGVHAKVWATRCDALRRFPVNRHHHRFFKRRLFAIHIGCNHLVWQRPFNEHHLAVSTVGNALRLDVQRLDSQQVGRVVNRA